MKLDRLLITFFICVIISLFPFGLTAYAGNKIYYLIFSFISSYALIISFNKNSISFDTFLGLLIWLGFWFKFTIQISFFDNSFPEGTGLFDYKSESYDQVLLISLTSIIAFVTARYLRLKFIFSYNTLQSNKIENKHYLNFYCKFRSKIFYVYFFCIFCFGLLNFFFIFFQKGTVPVTYLPFGFNNFINWLLMFGLTTFSATIIYFEFIYKKKNSNKIIKYGLLETFISSLSVLSRAMIFNGSAIIFGFYRLIELNKVEIKKKIFVKYIILLFILFLISLLSVSKIRQNKGFPVDNNIYKILPKIETKSIGEASRTANFTNYFSNELNKIIFLAAGRWVGIDGVMAVYGNKNLDFKSFLNSFNESFNYSNSYYEIHVKENKYKYIKNQNIYTVYVPGFVGFLYYTNSLIFLFFGVFVLCIFCSMIEYASFKISRGNVIFSYVIGNILAYRLAHFGYLPQNSYKLLLAIIFNLVLMYFIFKMIKYFYKK